jgi:hypothetical protein
MFGALTILCTIFDEQPCGHFGVAASLEHKRSNFP